MAALQLLGMGRPRASAEGPREAGIGQRRGCPAALMIRWGARIPLRGLTFLRKAPLRPSRSHHSASLRLALHPKNRSLHTRPTARFRFKTRISARASVFRVEILLLLPEF